jgi:hypothetical protein
VSRQVSNDRWPGERSCGHIGLRCAMPTSSRARCRPSADWSPTTLRSPGCTRRVHLFGSTSLPEEAFLRQAMRRLITRSTGFLGWPTLISDRDSNWNAGVNRLLETAAGRVVRIHARTPNGQASAGRFVHSMTETCVDRVVSLRQGHLRQALPPLAAHYLGDRNHKRLRNQLTAWPLTQPPRGRVFGRSRLRGLSARTIVQPHSILDAPEFWDSTGFPLVPLQTFRSSRNVLAGQRACVSVLADARRRQINLRASHEGRAVHDSDCGPPRARGGPHRGCSDGGPGHQGRPLRIHAREDCERTIRVSVDPKQINVSANGQQAPVSAQVQRTSIPKAGNRHSITIPTTFVLEKRGGRWIIVSTSP